MFLKLNFAETTQKKNPWVLCGALAAHHGVDVGPHAIQIIILEDDKIQLDWLHKQSKAKQSKKYTAFFSEKIGKHKARRLRSPFQKWESGSSRLTSHPELEEIKKSLDSSSLRSP